MPFVRALQRLWNLFRLLSGRSHHVDNDPMIDLEFRGCGICVAECPGHTVILVNEREASHTPVTSSRDGISSGTPTAATCWPSLRERRRRPRRPGD